MSWKTAARLLLILPVLSSPVRAADATAAGADTVRTGLERYFGHGPVAVTPAGAAYRIDLDLRKMLSVLQPFGVVLDPVTLGLTATPQDDGLWHVTSGGLPLVTVRMRDQVLSVAANNQRFDGLFDPRLPAFTQAAGSYDSLSVGATGDAAPTQARQLGQGLQTVTGTPAGDGVVDLKVATNNASYAQDVALNGGPGGSVPLSVKSGATADALAVDGLRVRALADLWTFLVAHPTGAALQADQAALKTLLRQAMPVFGRWKQDGSLEALSLATPFGPVLARSAAGGLDLTGLVADGSAGVALRADGLAIPTGPLPAWAPALLPTAIDLHATVSGLELGQAAEAVVAGLDLAAAQPLPPEVLDAAGRSAVPRDHVAVTVGDSRLTTPTVEARMAGEVHFAGPVPSFKLTVHATGLDAAIAAIRDKASADATAAQAIALVTLLKGYGKADAGGALTWVVVADGTGTLTVNDVPLPVGGPPQ